MLDACLRQLDRTGFNHRFNAQKSVQNGGGNGAIELHDGQCLDWFRAETFAAQAGEAARLRLVHAERHAEGMAETLKAAIVSLPADSEGAFVFLGDMPRVPLAVFEALAEAIASGALAAAPIFDGQRGHPVLFAASLYPRLMALSGDRGAASVLAQIGDGVALVSAPDGGVLFDVDRPGDANA